MARFAYFYFNRNAPDKLALAVPAHVQYWHQADLPDYTGGPFADRTGGLISFTAPSQQAAAALVAHDPFVQVELIERHWLKEWQA